MRTGTDRAVVRARGHREERELLLEAEIFPAGRDRVRVNRQPLRRSRDLLGAFRATVFSPDDLALVKEGPSGRRRYLDSTLVATDVRMDDLVGRVERSLRQRNALLKAAGGRLDDSTRTSLDVWDERLGTDGEALACRPSCPGRPAHSRVGQGLRRTGWRRRHHRPLRAALGRFRRRPRAWWPNSAKPAARTYAVG